MDTLWIKNKEYRVVNSVHDYVAALTKEQDKLKDTLGDLVDIQNGPPLIRDTDRWDKIIKEAFDLLGR